MSWKRKMYRNSIRGGIKVRQHNFRKSQCTPKYHGTIELVKSKIRKER